MANPRGFIDFARQKGTQRPVAERLRDYREFEAPLADAALKNQAGRCMDCGIPFCHQGCPLGNLVPEWNDRVHRGDAAGAQAALLATNNFPEITGRVCPAPCEAACVLNIEGSPVTIKEVERAIADDLFGRPLVAEPAAQRHGERVAVVGSGPAGLAAAQELARRGYDVTVFERDDRLGGLLRYGIPDFKLEKALIDRRIAQLEAEGVRFVTGVDVGRTLTAPDLRKGHDAVVVCTGARRPRELEVPGRQLDGVHLAMDYLTQQNRRVAGDTDAAPGIVAQGKRVVILGGGDTGSDCLGTALRQGAVDVLQLELMPAPPNVRRAANPWPEWPLVMRTSSSQEEGGARDFALLTRAVLGEERVRALSVVGVTLEGGKLVEKPGTAREIPCDLVLLAMGFVGPEAPLVDALGLVRDGRGNVKVDATKTSLPGVFAAGDVARGASLVVWAIAEGRRAAAQCDAYLAARRDQRPPLSGTQVGSSRVS